MESSSSDPFGYSDSSEIGIGDLPKTELQYAVLASDAVRVRTLLERGDNPNAVSSDRRSPLYIACKNRSTDCVRALLAANANVDACFSDESGHPLYAAISHDDHSCAELLLEAGARLGVHDGHLLLLACRGNSAECADVLIRYGADVNYQTADWGVSCAQRCCTYGRDGVLDVLLKAGAPMDRRDFDGDTPLHQAVYSKRERCAKLLVYHGADLFERNHLNQRPIDLAECTDEIRKVLKQAMSKCLAILIKKWCNTLHLTILGNPCSLKHLCRLFIRKAMSRSRLNDMKSFDIPQSLIDYLFFKR